MKPKVKKHISSFFLTIASILGLSMPSYAESIHEVSAGVVSVSSLGASDGIASLFIDVRLKHEWQTYHKSSKDYDTHMKLIWRDDINEKISFYDIDWPPFVTRDYYGEQIEVYRNQVLFPVSVTFDNYDDIPEVLEFDLEIFFCSNVCLKENLPVRVEI